MSINLIVISFQEGTKKALEETLRKGWVQMVGIASKIANEEADEDSLIRAGALKETMERLDELAKTVHRQL